MLTYWILGLTIALCRAYPEQVQPLHHEVQSQVQPQKAQEQQQQHQPQQHQSQQQQPQQLHQPQGDLRQIIFGPTARQQQFLSHQQIPHELLPVVEPQFQLPLYNFVSEKQQFPRVLIYQGGVSPGHTLLLQPGNPGNFIIPQQPQPQPQPNPGPNIILGNDPQKPVFVAGYPKPAHIPPIEKDAEEIPTNPAKIPPLHPQPSEGRNKPEKLETFNEPEKPEELPSKQPEELDPTILNRNPTFSKPSTSNLRPGQRFFILNGQPLFSNYPYLFNENDLNLKYAEATPALAPQHVLTNVPQDVSQNIHQSNQPNSQRVRLNLENRFLQKNNNQQKNQQIPQATQLKNIPQQYQQFDDFPFFRQSNDFNQGAQFKFPSLEQLNYNQNPVLSSSLPFNVSPFGRLGNNQEFYQFDDDSVVIEAKGPQEASQSHQNTGLDRSIESTISQAQPGAVALAGPGGVAAAAPRGSAFVGKGGVAVSSPTATAVAGPTKEEDKKKPNKNKKPSNK